MELIPLINLQEEKVGFWFAAIAFIIRLFLADGFWTWS